MNAELQAAETLLNKGIKVPARAPLFLRLFGKRNVSLVIRHPYLGTMYRIGLIYEQAEMEELFKADAYSLDMFRKYSRPMGRIAAQAWLNGHLSGWLFGRLAGWWMVWAVKPVRLYHLCQTMETMMMPETFYSSIISVRGARMTPPKVSHEDQGS